MSERSFISDCAQKTSGYAEGYFFGKIQYAGVFRGLTLNGTKTHVKQYYPPLTPLLMASDALLSPVLPA